MRKRTRMLMILVLLIAVVVGCTPQATTPTPQATPAPKQETFVRYAQYNPPTGLFHPDILTSSYDSAVTSLIFEPLIQLNPKLEYEGALAEKWEISPDNLSVTFHLRKNAKWHDGKPFIADDVKFSLEFVGHKDYKGPRYSNVEKIKGMKEFHEGKATSVSGIEIIDQNTVKITTDGVLASFLYSIGGRPMMPKHLWGKADVATAEQNKELLLNPVGTGPFKLKEFKPDSHATVVANPDYWGGKPKIDGIVIQAVAQDTAQTQMLKGEIDLMDVSDFDPQFIKLFTDKQIKVLEADLVAVQYMGVNNRLPVFQKKEVRQALAHAINRQGIVDQFLYGKGNVANNPFPKSIWAHPGDTALKPYNYDKNAAIDLFKKAGFEYKDSVMYYEGKPVKWVLKYPSGNKAREKAAIVIQQNLKEIGIEIDARVMQFAALSADVAKADFELMLMGMGTSFDADQKYIWATGANFNYCGWDDPKTNQLLDEGLKYIDIEKRKAIYREWAIHMNEQIPNVWLYNWKGGLAVSPKLKNVQFFAGGAYYQVEKWEYTK
ncbi:MAG: ABC transporter substrate-binding protein [Bacillota bacterium]